MKPSPRLITQKLISYVHAMAQNNAITLNERNKLIILVRKGLTEGYDDLIDELNSLNKRMVYMSNLPQMMLDEINGTKRKEEIDVI